MEGVELSKMLASLRKELGAAQQEGDGKDIKFAIDDIELELQLTVAEEGGGKAGVKFWVVNAETGAKVTSQSIQKIKLNLKPETKGETTKVNDEDTRQD
ncbi:MAG: trypco2 family protein [Nitrospiria bacterium]